MRALLLISVAASFLGGCTYLNQRLGLPEDNPIEGAIEEQVKDRTGVDIDFTPRSKEMRRQARANHLFPIRPK